MRSYRPSRAAITTPLITNVMFCSLKSISLQKFETPSLRTADVSPRSSPLRDTKGIGAVDGGTGTIGSHVAKLILYTSLSLVCISNRNQRCLRKNFLHNGFSDYFLFCTKRGAFIHEQRSDRSRPIMRTFKKEKKSVHCINI